MIIENIYTDIKAIIDSIFVDSQINSKSIEFKSDKSIVTNYDLKLENKIIEYFKTIGIKENQIIAEETFNNNIYKHFDFNDNFLIVDPIDGTENFAFGLNEWGSVFTLRINNKFLNFLYIPSCGYLLTDSISTPVLINDNSLHAYSTKSLNTLHFDNIDSTRIFGSASYAFSLFLMGRLSAFTYSSNAKLWDCYTGLYLSNMLNAKIFIEGTDIKSWLKKPSFLTSFRVNW